MRTRLFAIISAAWLWAGLSYGQIIHAACGDISSGFQGGIDCGNTGGPSSLPDSIAKITNALLFAIGVIAVIMMIIGGIKYAMSSGDPKNLESAKNTILFAVVGIVIAILAYAIVNFVLGQFGV